MVNFIRKFSHTSVCMSYKCWNMIEYDRIDISERIDVNKTNASKECGICHYLVISINHIFTIVVMV